MRTFLALLLLGGPVFGDELVLRNGNRLQGIVTESGDRVTIRMDCGSITIPLHQVAKIVYKSGPLAKFQKERSRIKTGDAVGYFKLGVWAKESGLVSKARLMFRQVLALEPDHEGARRGLGYYKHEGRWLTQEQFLVARGFVRFRGKWLKQKTVEQLLHQEAELERVRERLASRERVAKLETDLRRFEIEAQLERDRLMAEVARIRATPYYQRRLTHLHTYGGFVFPCGCANFKKK